MAGLGHAELFPVGLGTYLKGKRELRRSSIIFFFYEASEKMQFYFLLHFFHYQCPQSSEEKLDSAICRRSCRLSTALGKAIAVKKPQTSKTAPPSRRKNNEQSDQQKNSRCHVLRPFLFRNTKLDHKDILQENLTMVMITGVGQ